MSDFVRRATASDVGGVGTGSPPNGIGDVCECGDLDQNGFVTQEDLDLYRLALVFPTIEALSPAQRDLCRVSSSGGESDECGIAQVVQIARALAGLPPEIEPLCAPTLPSENSVVLPYVDELDTDAGWTFRDQVLALADGPGAWKFQAGALVQTSDISDKIEGIEQRGTTATIGPSFFKSRSAQK